MAIEVTVRHAVHEEAETKKQIRGYAEERAVALEAEFPPIEWVHGVIDRDGAKFWVGLDIRGGRHMNVEAKHEDIDVYVAINAAFDKAQAHLRKQAKKNAEQKFRTPGVQEPGEPEV